MNIPTLRVRGEDGKMHNIPALTGPRGPKGDPYTLTEADKQEIVEAVITELQDRNLI